MAYNVWKTAAGNRAYDEAPIPQLKPAAAH